MNVLESFSLQGKCALLTGGAGLYGRQIVAALAEAGAEVFIAARHVAQLEEVAAHYEKVHALELDLASEESVHHVVAEVVRRAGKLDILVNNAVTRCACSSWSLSMDEFDQSLRVNASALFLLSRLAAEDMKKRGAGSIINIGSYMGIRGPNFTNYTGTEMMRDPSPAYFYEKGGMTNFTRFAACVLGPDGIRVNCLLPGGLQMEGHNETFVAQYSANTPLGRLANQTDLKGAIVFFASDASAYITGVNLPVDGGYTAK